METALRKPALVKASALGLAVLGGLMFLGSPGRAGSPRTAVYSPDNSRIFWFVLTTDTHIGARGSTDSGNLTWLVNTGRSVINPDFFVVTGDLTDSTNGSFLGIPNGPYQREWDEYKSILSAAGMNATNFFDIPGNHDAYNDQSFAYYLANSVQGRATGRKQLSWSRTFGFGKYHFLGVNSCDNTGSPFSLTFPWGDHAGLDAGELDFIRSELGANATADLTLVFGHHPVTDTGNSDDTWLFYGHQEFIGLLDSFGASAYGYGHTHRSSETLFQGNSYTGTMANGGILYLNLASLAKSSSNQYSIIAVDCNGVSSVTQTVKTWPVVLITAPVASAIGASANPYSYSVPGAASNPVRALVFDANPVTRVEFRIDGAGSWYPMTQVAGNPKLYEGVWNASGLGAGSHRIEVQALGTATRADSITVNVTASNSAPAATNDSYSTNQGTALSIPAPGVLANDTDANGDPLTASLVAPPAHGDLTLNANGSFEYVPEASYSGTDSFSYIASDGELGSNTATVSITVNASGTDTVTILKAEYRTKTKQLTVEATSTAAPQAVLTVFGNGTLNYGTMTYNSTAGKYTFLKKVTPAPATVSVTSNRGGTATKTVTTVK